MYKTKTAAEHAIVDYTIENKEKRVFIETVKEYVVLKESNRITSSRATRIKEYYLRQQIMQSSTTRNSIRFVVNKKYGFYGITELKQVYDRLSKEVMQEIATNEVLKVLNEFPEEKFMEIYAHCNEQKERSTSFQKAYTTYMTPRLEGAIRIAIFEEAKKDFPQLTMHYLNKYVCMRKLNLSLEDSDEKIHAVLAQNNSVFSTKSIKPIIRLRKAFTKIEKEK